MSLLERFLSDLADDRDVGPEIACRRDIPPRPARYGEYPEGMAVGVREGLSALGIRRLYSHQSAAAGRAAQGEDVLELRGESLLRILGHLGLDAVEAIEEVRRKLRKDGASPVLPSTGSDEQGGSEMGLNRPNEVPGPPVGHVQALRGLVQGAQLRHRPENGCHALPEDELLLFLEPYLRSDQHRLSY